ncbi:MAG: UDP-N-acetylmuramoyl-L-alanyl-D-glutamate--2,6-diaminopimelate ligase [Chloroflexi bacterium]|nr:UDP-N-acetylmuramoyl-L-alanyl-D-glutamate--2,6-diaminopimelate ligase [Chloroflexota bacterium]
MLLSSLITNLLDTDLSGGDCEISGIAFDSRLIRPGWLFVCIRGQEADGHDYAGDALKNGAAALLVEDFLPLAARQVRTADTRLALARIAKTFHGRPDESLGLVGVTGTDGKTTTASLIAWILRSAGVKTGEVTTANISTGGQVSPNLVHQTTPSSLELHQALGEMRDRSVQWAVLETTSHGLDQHRVTGFAFNRAVFTSITHEHLDYHGTLEAYVEAKARLLDIQGAADEGRWGKVAVLPRDSRYWDLLRARACGQVLGYGRASDADVKVLSETVSSDAIDFTASTPWGQISVGAGLPGAFNIENCLAALTCAASIGVSLELCADAIAAFPGVRGRMQRVDCGQPFEVIVDFAHTPNSLESALQTFSKRKGRLLVVFGGAGERDTQKRPLMGAVAARLADEIVITNEDPRNEDALKIARDIAEGAASGSGGSCRKLEIILDRRDAIAAVLRSAQPGDTVLLAGKGHEASIITAEKVLSWDEAGVTREILTSMGYDCRAAG